MNLENKVGVVTGASSGIGRAIALDMASKKMKLLLAARRSSPLQEVRSEVVGRGGEATVLVADVSTREGAESVVRQASERFGSLDVLVNNAGVGFFGPLEEATDAAIEKVTATNLMAPIYSTRAAIPLMKGRGGAIVNISSLSAFAPQPWLSLYSTTKAALRAFSTSMQIELRPLGIRVIGVYPGYIRTDFEKAEVTTDAGRKAGRREEMGKPGRVLDATNVSKTVVKALEMDAEGDVFIGASGRVLALVATHLSPLVKRYWRNRYRRVLGRAGG